jgi:hypothetical protein
VIGRGESRLQLQTGIALPFPEGQRHRIRRDRGVVGEDMKLL